MFVTSFIPLWLSIAVIDTWNVALFIIDSWDGKGKFVDNLVHVLCGSIIQLVNIVIIAILIFVGVAGISVLPNKKLSEGGKRLPKGTTERATKANKLSSELSFAYILPMTASDFSNL